MNQLVNDAQRAAEQERGTIDFKKSLAIRTYVLNRGRQFSGMRYGI